MDKEYKEEILDESMRLFGRGKGYFGFPIKFNHNIRLTFIWLAFGGMGIYLLATNQFVAGLISFSIGLMFSGFNNLLRD